MTEVQPLEVVRVSLRDSNGVTPAGNRYEIVKVYLAADYERDVAAARDKALNDAIEAVEALPGSPRGTRTGRTSALTDAVTEITALRKPVDGDR